MVAGPAFFTVQGPSLVPGAEARSPWSDRMLHGRLLAALAARAIESEQLPEGFVPARLTVDLFRAAPMAAVQITTSAVREGRRVRTAEASIVCEGREAGRASAVMLRTEEDPPGRVWSPPPWAVPDPETLALPPVPAGTSRFPLDIRQVGGGGFGTFGPKRVWVREVRDLVQGETPSGFVRAVGAADLANPFANSGDAGLAFINADLTVYLARVPVGEWIGLDVSARVSDAGVAVGGCDLYDRQGPIGSCAVASVVNAPLGL